MVNTSLLLTDGGIITLVFTAYVVGTLLWKPRIWLHDFPADLQALPPPKTDQEKRQTTLLGIPFFIIPPASAYLLTNRLSIMAVIAAAIGSAGAFWGYDLARGNLFGVIDLPGTWDTSISASMVLMMLLLFVIVLAASPHFGLVAVVLRRFRRRRTFAEFVILGHMTHHGDARELPLSTLAGQIRWEPERLGRVAERLKRKGFVTLVRRSLAVTQRGADAIDRFRRETFTRSGESPDSPKAPPRR